MIVADLPGSYSLSAGSDEEIITLDYIASGNADLALVMADASQLKRSLYMLADFVGMQVPAILVLNMMIGLLTPPVGMSLYMLSSASKRSFGDVVKMVSPWLIPLFIALAMVTYIEPITMFLPGLFGYV